MSNILLTVITYRLLLWFGYTKWSVRWQLLGAGGSRFLPFYVTEQYRTRVRRTLNNLKEIDFKFDNKDTSIIHHNKVSLYIRRVYKWKT